ncbi:MAG: hypothetical protein V4685_15090 [Bacteroidota bacterium]
MARILMIAGVFSFTALLSCISPKSDYELSIQKGKIIKQEEKTYWDIPTTLTNNTNDTLRYYSMSCSWQDYYSVDNQKLEVRGSDCDKNIPKILTLNPGQKKSVDIQLVISQPMDGPEIKFRIGFNLIIAPKNKNSFDFEDGLEKKNVIWSNPISM